MALFQLQATSPLPPISNTVCDLSSLQLCSAEALRDKRQVQNDNIQSSVCTQAVWIIFWLTAMILIGYPIAILSGLAYALVCPLSIFECWKINVMSLLLIGLELPLSFAKNAINAKELIKM